MAYCHFYLAVSFPNCITTVSGKITTTGQAHLCSAGWFNMISTRYLHDNFVPLNRTFLLISCRFESKGSKPSNFDPNFSSRSRFLSLSFRLTLTISGIRFSALMMMYGDSKG